MTLVKASFQQTLLRTYLFTIELILDINEIGIYSWDEYMVKHIEYLKLIHQKNNTFLNCDTN